MEISSEDFRKEQEKIEKLPDSDKKAYYMHWLETHTEKTTARVEVTLSYAQLLYREGQFREVMEVLMPVVMNHEAYPYCENIITCFNQMGLAVNCESEYTMARQFFQMALDVAQIHQVSSVYAKQHNNIGLTYYDQDRFEDAEREYRLAEAWISESDRADIMGEMVYGNWANVLLKQHRWPEALAAYQKGLAYQINETDDVDIMVVYMIITYKLGMQEEYQRAKQDFTAVITDQTPDRRAFCYWRLLDYEIDLEDQEFVAAGYDAMESFLKEPWNVLNWKGRTNYAQMLYEKAKKEGNTAAMIDLMEMRSRIQLETIDITEKKRLDALNEYIDITVEKQKALEQAEKATRAKSQFLSNMSHDIRTPMNAIFGITQLMEHDKNDPEKMDDHIHKLKSSSQHLLSLINDVLDMSRIESTEIVLNRESINLADQVAQLKSILYPQTQERRQHFTILIHDIRHEYLIGDAVRLRQILINLLSNAVKYTPNGGSITLELTEQYSGENDRTTFEFSVSDTGYGMSEEFIKRIFEPFTRAEDSTTNKIQGTGLGMAITKSIVDLMGGTITLESELGKGSRFTVTLPLEIDPESAPYILAKKILLIANDELLIKNMTVSFGQAGIGLFVVNTIEQAEQYLTENTAEVILLAGRYDKELLADAAARLKKAAGTATVVFCVDYDQWEITYNLLSACGIYKVITRPFFMTELAAVLNQPADDTARGLKSDTILQGMSFLCAEDNQLNAEILEAILELEGASCTILPDGRQLVDMFEAVRPGEYDAILMDMQMPVMDGLDATRAVRHGSNPLGRTIPIIAMTANAFSSDIQECLNVGMDAHLPKPLDIDALKQTVRTVLGRERSGGADECPLYKDSADV